MGISLLRLSEFKEFYLWLRETREDSTCRIIIDNYSRINTYLKKKNITYPTYEAVTEYIYDLQLSGKKASYINHITESAKAYTHFLFARNYVCDTKTLTVRKIRAQATLKSTLSDEEIEAFLALPRPQVRGSSSKNWEVWTLFFSILAFSGMRPTEAAHLKINDIDFGRNIFVLNKTKTHDIRYVPIAKNLIEPLKRHIQTCSSYLFPSKQGGNNNNFGKVVDSVDWGYNFQTRIKRLGIKREKLSVYSLRHSFITRLLSEDLNIFKVQKIVGHKRLETTNVYTHLTTKDIQKAILKDPLYIRSNPQGKLEYIREVIRGLVVDNVSGLRFTIKESEHSIIFEAHTDGK